MRIVRPQGFTLVELMVVIVIIAILAAIALPSYQNYIKKSHIQVAKSDLMTLSLVLESYYQRNLSYPDQSSELVESATNKKISEKFSTWKPSENIFEYKLVSNQTESTYTLTATGTGNLSSCTLTLKQDSTRTIVGCLGVTW